MLFGSISSLLVISCVSTCYIFRSMLVTESTTLRHTQEVNLQTNTHTHQLNSIQLVFQAKKLAWEHYRNLLEEVELWYLVDTEVTPPTNPKEMEKHTKKSTKVKQIIHDLMKDLLIPHIAKNKTVKEMFDEDLYLCKAHHKIPKSCVTMEETTIVTLVGSSLVLVMEEVHHKGGFLGDLKGSNSKFSSQAYHPLS
jgi:hypothetical protein